MRSYRRRWRPWSLLVSMAMVLPSGVLFYGDQEAILRERARAAADTLMVRLLARLTEEYSKGGAARGVEVCSQVAQQLTADVSRQEGVRIRRVSLKVRNQRNMPDQWERSVLQQWEQDRRAGKEIQEIAVVRTERGQRNFRFMRPIKVGMPLCLECHGTDVKPEVMRLIRQRYPTDNATGYRIGDLRGAFSVTIPVKNISSPHQ